MKNETLVESAGAKSAPVLHFGIMCDGSNQRPLVGKRYHKIGEDYDLNETEFTKIPRHEQLKYEVIAIPGAIPVPVTPALVAENAVLTKKTYIPVCNFL